MAKVPEDKKHLVPPNSPKPKFKKLKKAAKKLFKQVNGNKFSYQLEADEILKYNIAAEAGDFIEGKIKRVKFDKVRIIKKGS